MNWVVSEYHGYNRHDTRKVERIGKKYQWIALYNILARVSDTYLVKNWGGEPLPISEAWGHIADESDPSSKLEEGIEQTNLRKLPLCQVIVKNPLGQLWLVGKDVLQGARNGR